MAVDTPTDGGKNPSAAYVDRRLMRGSAVLMTGGLLACMAGATVGVVAVLRAFRQYVSNREEPPRETARRRWAQARSATAAGVGAWQDYDRKTQLDAVR
jgi:hypothetical protein